jgi:hypothetical protein
LRHVADAADRRRQPLSQEADGQVRVLRLDGLIVEERDGTLAALEPARASRLNSKGEGA